MSLTTYGHITRENLDRVIFGEPLTQEKAEHLLAEHGILRHIYTPYCGQLDNNKLISYLCEEMESICSDCLKDIRQSHSFKHDPQLQTQEKTLAEQAATCAQNLTTLIGEHQDNETHVLAQAERIEDWNQLQGHHAKLLIDQIPENDIKDMESVPRLQSAFHILLQEHLYASADDLNEKILACIKQHIPTSKLSSSTKTALKKMIVELYDEGETVLRGFKPTSLPLLGGKLRELIKRFAQIAQQLVDLKKLCGGAAEEDITQDIDPNPPATLFSDRRRLKDPASTDEGHGPSEGPTVQPDI